MSKHRAVSPREQQRRAKQQRQVWRRANPTQATYNDIADTAHRWVEMRCALDLPPEQPWLLSLTGMWRDWP